ncbi:hypothetical protein IKG50_03715 [Candidatus Saccharibacteria bacterium]|nr:hypothetical protein [Candidatus Saccharibacteria bacterium]
MDNKAYLDQIAVKGKVKSGPILTPMLIKLIAAGVIALITMIVVGNVISGSNEKVTQTYERAYLRITNLANEEGPLSTYVEKIKDSDLRAYALTLLSTLKSTSTTVSSLSGNIGIKTDKISKTVQSEEDANTSDLSSSFEDAVLTGTLDNVYASKAYYQVTTLIAIEAEARAKTPNVQFAETLDQSTDGLLILQENFKKYNQEH